MATLAVIALAFVGCGRPVSEADKLIAKTVVERALASDSYDGFLSNFTKDNRDRMHRSQVWIKWWQQKVGKDRPAWRVSEVRDDGHGRVIVVTESRKSEGGQQYYTLVKDGYGWRISAIESRRE